jgi:hypothetical protein
MFRDLRAFPFAPLFLCAILAAQHSSTVSADQTWNDLAAGNRRFVVGKSASRDFIASAELSHEESTSPSSGAEMLGQPCPSRVGL